MIDAAFWASLRREEGYAPRISLTYAAPEHISAPLIFERPLQLTPESLTRIAPAVERPGIHLGVWREGGELVVWGAARKLPAFSFVLEVVSPGLLVIKHTRGSDSGKFVNVAVLEGDQLKMIDPRAVPLAECPALLLSLLDLESQFTSEGPASVLMQMAVSMRAHGRGGSLLVVPANSEAWKESILHPITYAVAPPLRNLGDLLREHPAATANGHWRDRIQRAIDGLAGLTAVDGATVMTEDYVLLAFGAKIIRRRGSTLVNRVQLTEPVEGVAATVTEPAHLGGTRHISAAQFIHDQRDALAMVASQDGRFTVLGWSPCDEIVQAHRIETLLL